MLRLLLRLADESKIKQRDLMLYWPISLQAFSYSRWKLIHPHVLSHGPVFCQEKKSFTFCSTSERHTLSFPCPLPLCLPLFCLFSPSSVFTSPTPAVFHLNISSSCLAAYAACQVSSRSQGPTLKWSTEVIFRGVCARKKDAEREKGGMRRRSGLRRRVVIRSEKVEETWEW